MKTGETHAALTGDLVDSTGMHADRLEAVRSGLLDAVGEVGRWEPGLLRSKPEFYRGDAWQLLLAKPGRALRVAVFLRAALRFRHEADTRIAIGIGGVDRISTRRISLSSGETFERSGRALDAMTSLTRLAIDVGSSDPLSPLLPAIADLCDALVRQWTTRQAELVCLAADPSELLHEDIAERLGISRQSVSRSLAGAGWTALRTTIDRFEGIEWENVSENR